MSKPYKASNGAWYTQALFLETHQDLDSGFKPVFTLYDEVPGYVCARSTFVALGDPTGYKWAMEYLGDYAHWQRLINCRFFKEAYDVWMAELNAKNQAIAIARITEIAASDSGQSLAAAKYLAESGWSKTSRRGRPSKAEVDGELKRQVQSAEATDEDMKRIGLKVINGGRD